MIAQNLAPRFVPVGLPPVVEDEVDVIDARVVAVVQTAWQVRFVKDRHVWVGTGQVFEQLFVGD